MNEAWHIIGTAWHILGAIDPAFREAITITLSILGVVNAIALPIIGMVLAGIRARQSASAEEQAKLKDDLKAATEKAIDEKLSTIQRLHDRDITEIKDRLRDGDQRFIGLDKAISALVKSDESVKVEILQAINALRERVVTRADLEMILKEYRK